MSTDIVNKILFSEKNFQSFKSLVNSKNEVLNVIIREKLFQSLKAIENDLKLELNLDENKILNYSASWKTFYFTNGKLKSLNLGIAFSFNTAKGYKDFIFGFNYLNPELKAPTIFESLKTNFKNEFNKSENSTVGWPCYKKYDEFINWENMEIQQKLIFGDNGNKFKNDITKKVTDMVKIIELI